MKEMGDTSREGSSPSFKWLRSSKALCCVNDNNPGVAGWRCQNNSYRDLWAMIGKHNQTPTWVAKLQWISPILAASKDEAFMSRISSSESNSDNMVIINKKKTLSDPASEEMVWKRKRNTIPLDGFAWIKSIQWWVIEICSGYGVCTPWHAKPTFRWTIYVPCPSNILTGALIDHVFM